MLASEFEDQTIHQHETDDTSSSSSSNNEQVDKGLLSFMKFRSWYKGGQILREHQESHENNNNNSIIIEGTNRKMHPQVAKVLQAQLESRTALLQARITEVDACANKIAELIAGYQYAQLCGFTEEDLALKRNQLTPKVSESLLFVQFLIDIMMD